MASRGQSGHYWINNTDYILKVYCNMELTCGRITGGYTRITNIDTTQGEGPQLFTILYSLLEISAENLQSFELYNL